ncbi:hypothetical protein [Thalassotalea agarivorans]|nr:hypothetical protein [Thalassotalea agarivorans]
MQHNQDITIGEYRDLQALCGYEFDEQLEANDWVSQSYDNNDWLFD